MLREKISGIYKIENLVNGKIYIGQSKDIQARKYTHISELKKNKHHSTHLQRSWNKYGEENFKWNTIEQCNLDTMNEKEKMWIAYFKSDGCNYGYNLDSGGNSNKIISEETRRKISKNHADISGEKNPFYGKKYSVETLEKIVSSEGYKNRTERIRGEGSHTAKLTTKIVIKIKELIRDGFTNTEIFNIIDNCSLQQISHIKNGYSWKHIQI